MKKLVKILTVVAAAAALIGVLLSAAYTQTVSDELTRLRRESRSDIVYLRTRVRELEGDLKSSLLEHWNGSAESDEGTAGETEGDPSESCAEKTEPVTEADEEAVTIPTHHSPETQPSTEDTEASLNTEAPVAAFLLTVHNGVIGVFNDSGELVRTVNVFVMTLPEAEQEALAVGIPAYSEDEMLALLEQYE